MSANRASTLPASRDSSGTNATGLTGWRSRILQNTLTATALLASIAYVPGMLVAYSAELWVLMAVDTLLWGLVVMLALCDRLPFGLRAAGLIGGWYVLAVFLLWIVGPVGSGLAWLLSVPVLAALFFGYRGAFASVALLGCTSVAYYFLLPVHRTGSYLAAGGSYDAAAWIACASSLLFLSALLSLSIARLLRGLEDSLTELEAAHREVSEMLAEREQLQEELLRSQKQNALGTLASGIAHDFNNMLVPILMASEEARDDAPPNSPQRQHLDRVIAAALRARNLIRRILDFSRSFGARRVPTALEPVLREAGALLRSSSPAGIDVQYRLNAPDAHVLGDSDELHQIIMNLGTNARLAMKDSGQLILASERITGEETVRITVEDTGPGIAPELRERIFDPFFTTRSSGTGTGLGLSIVHRLVASMGGTITVESMVGEGTRFVLDFPEVAVDPEAEADANPAPVGAAGHGRMRTVLVVDDEELVRGMISVILTRNGYLVREAGSPESALRQVHDDPHGFDLMITDQAMPSMTGLQLIRDVRSIRPDLPVILVSGHLESEAIEQARHLGLDGTLDKPFARRALLDLVNRVMAEHRPNEHEGVMA